MAQEKQFEEKIKKYLKEKESWYLKYWGGGGFTKTGVPDLLICRRGWFMAVEIKGPMGRPTDLQIYHLRAIDRAGGRAILLYPEDFELFRLLVDDPDDERVYGTLKSRWKHFENKTKKENETMAKKTVGEMAQGQGLADAQAAKSNYSPVEAFRTALLKTKREGMEELLEFIEGNGFMDAPCSGGNHLAQRGGLLEHSLNVWKYAEKIGVSLLGGAEYNRVQDSVVIAALLHDLGKMGDYDKPMYVDNILKSGKPSEAKPFKRNPALLAVPHAVRSVKLATLYIDLTEDEEWAILCHDGLYDFMKYDLKGKETWLQLIIHMADMWSSHIIEGGSDSQEGGE